MITRRGFVKILSGIIAAPAVVKADSLMKIIVPERSFVMVPTPEIIARSSVINLSSIRELLMPGLQKVTKEYEINPFSDELVFLEPPK